MKPLILALIGLLLTGCTVSFGHDDKGWHGGVSVDGKGTVDTIRELRR